jgi:hypothetical protein
VLLFDEFGQLKYHIQSRVRSWRQNDRLEALANSGALLASRASRRHFAQLHRAGATSWPGANPNHRSHSASQQNPFVTEVW